MPYPFEQSNLAGTPIDKRRRATWRWPSVTISVPRKSLVEFAPIPQQPRFGDLALCRVETIGANTFIENSAGCNMSIFPGTVLLGTFAPRYALDEFEGAVPDTLEDDKLIALLNRGGTIGEVVSRNSHHKDPTMLRVLAYLKDGNGEIANLKNFGRKGKSAPRLDPTTDRTLIVVVGTSMNSGKSSTAKAITYGLTASGHNVVAAKVTGQGCRRDVLLMKAAGATYITDFTDFGYASTYLLPEDEMRGLFWQIFNDLYEKAGPGGYMVMELADGINQRETSMILADKVVQRQIGHVAFSCCDPLSAVAGIETLRARFGLEATALSGPAANSELGLKEVSQFLGDFPAFNNMVMDVPQIASLFSGPRGAGTALHVRPAAVVEKSDPAERAAAPYLYAHPAGYIRTPPLAD